MKYYAVIDTNVIVSAFLNWESIPGRIAYLSLHSVIIPIYNDETINELKNVLSRPKFSFKYEEIEYFISNYINVGINMSIVEQANELFVDDSDKVFYEIALEAKKSFDTYLISGNIRHFPKHDFIVTPKEMLDIIIRESYTS